MAFEYAQTSVTMRAPSTAFVQYQLVAAATSASMYIRAITTGSRQAALGVLQNQPTVAGEAVQVCVAGVTKVISSSTKVGFGCYWWAKKGAACSTASTPPSGSPIYGPALETCSASDGVITSVFRVARSMTS